MHSGRFSTWGADGPRAVLRPGRWRSSFALLALALSHGCGFPSFEIRHDEPSASGGRGGSSTAGMGANAGTSGSGAGAMGGAGSGGASGAAAAGLSGEGGGPTGNDGGDDAGARAGAGGEGGAQGPSGFCPPPVNSPPNSDSCYDGKLSPSEINIDCGGDCIACSRGSCNAAVDCLSRDCRVSSGPPGTCATPVRVSFRADERNDLTLNPTFHMWLENSGTASFQLKGRQLRYYFRRNGVVEPLTLQRQEALATVGGGGLSLGETSWQLIRTEPSALTAYDAYVEVKFGDSLVLGPGDTVEVTQQLLAADSSKRFQQSANYSHSSAEERAVWLRTTAYDAAGALSWGLEPRTLDPGACFFKAWNLNGEALTIDGHPWLSGVNSGIETEGAPVTSIGPTYPAASGALATLLSRALRLNAGHNVVLPVDNGTYLAQVFAVSTGSGSESGVLTVQGVEPDESSAFTSKRIDYEDVHNALAWAPLGPFRVQVNDRRLVVAVKSGTVRLAGVQLYHPE